MLSAQSKFALSLCWYH